MFLEKLQVSQVQAILTPLFRVFVSTKWRYSHNFMWTILGLYFFQYLHILEFFLVFCSEISTAYISSSCSRNFSLHGEWVSSVDLILLQKSEIVYLHRLAMRHWSENIQYRYLQIEPCEASAGANSSIGNSYTVMTLFNWLVGWQWNFSVISSPGSPFHNVTHSNSWSNWQNWSICPLQERKYLWYSTLQYYTFH